MASRGAKTSRMSDKDFKRWQARLTHENRVWDEHGLTGNASAGRTTVLRYLEAYRNHQWYGDGWGGLPLSECVTVNVFFSTIKVLLSQNSARNAKPVIKPKGQDLASNDSKQRAEINEVLLASVAQDLKLKKFAIDPAVLDAFLMPFGVVRHVYLPRIEKFTKDGDLMEVLDTVEPDFPSVVRVQPWNFRCDSMVERLDPEFTRWCAFRTIHHIDDIKRNPSFTNRDDLRPGVTAEFEKTLDYANSREKGPDWADLVEVWNIYDKVERTYLAISPQSQKPLKDLTDWPIAWKTLPYNILYFNPQSDSPFPIAFPELIYGLQEEINKAATIISANVKRMRRLLIMNDGFSNEEKQKLLDADLVEAINCGTQDPRSALFPVEVSRFPQEITNWVQVLVEWIRETMGVSDMDRAQRINVESATEASGVISGSQTIRSLTQEAVEGFWSGIYQNLHYGIQRTQTENILLPIFDDKSASIAQLQGQPYVTVKPGDLQGEFQYGVVAGSTLPENPDDEMRRNVALYSIIKGNPAVDQNLAIRDIILAARKDPERWMAKNDDQIAGNVQHMTDMGVANTVQQAVPHPNGSASPPSAAGGATAQAIDPNLMAMLKPGGAVQ